MEYFDILDKYAMPVGQIAAKGTSLCEGMYSLGVEGYIVTAEGYFLLQQRSYNKKLRPGSWDIHMGHVIAGESSKQAIIREIYEEIGLLAEEHYLDFVRRFFWKDEQLFVDIYLITIPVNLKALVLQQDEVISTKLITKAEMITFVHGMTYRPKLYRNFILETIEHICPTV